MKGTKGTKEISLSNKTPTLILIDRKEISKQIKLTIEQTQTLDKSIADCSVTSVTSLL